MWNFPMTKRSTAIIIAGIVLNSLLFWGGRYLQLPIGINYAGTAYAAILLGPLAGVLVALVHSLILAGCCYGWMHFTFFLVGAAVAGMAGFAAKRGALRGILAAVGLVTVCYLFSLFLDWVIAVTLVTPPDMKWAGELYNALRMREWDMSLAFLASEGLINIPEIVIAALVAAVGIAVTPGGIAGADDEKADKKDKKKKKKDKKNKIDKKKRKEAEKAEKAEKETED